MIGGRKPSLQWGHFAAVWLCLIAVLVTSIAIPQVSAAEEYEAPTLFYNDTPWAMDQYYPSLGYIIGSMQDFWIPLSFFEEMEDIRIKRGAAKNYTVFVIQDTAAEKYLSFNINDSSYAQTERGTLILIHTMLYSKERYLPMREVCAYFGWTFEISEDRSTARICDGGQQKSFSELLAAYAPPAVTEQDTSEQAVTEQSKEPTTEPVKPDTEPVTEALTPPEIYRSPFVYLTFEDIDAVYTPVILDTLQAHGIKATFFVTGEQMSRYSDVVLRILTDGHALGLHGMTDDETQMQKTEGLLASFAEENELLYAMIRRKMRLIRLPNGSHSGKVALDAAQKAALAEEGYILWDWNISAMDHDTAYSADMVLAKIDAAMRTSYYPVIRMHCTETASEVLEPLLLRFAETNTAVRVITVSDNPVVFP